MLYFDLETGPLPAEMLRDICPPYERPPHPGAFDPAAIKTGNLKDPAKIREKIAAAEAAHLQAVASYETDCIQGEQGHFAKFCEEAALHATTGHVVAIGLLVDDDETPTIIDCDGELEEEGIKTFWGCMEDAGPPFVGFNNKGFDFKFLILKSWMLGIRVPGGLRRGARYWTDDVVDLMEMWMFGPGYISLDEVAKLLGFEGKKREVNGVEVSGKDFHWLWRDHREAAAEYLRQDVMLCVRIANAMGVG